MVAKPERKYGLPCFLSNVVSQAIYTRWIDQKAAAHFDRDKKRGNRTATKEAYKRAIHAAVVASEGLDAYTGEHLHWSLIGSYDNAASKAKGRHYKARLALLPTLDHVGDGLGPADFKICGWRTNDAKHDLSHSDFVELCRRVISHYEKLSGTLALDSSNQVAAK